MAFGKQIQLMIILALIATTIACSEDKGKKSGDDGEELSKTKSVETRVIYGEDNRREIYELTDDSLIDIADATVALFEKSNLLDRGSYYEMLTSDYNKLGGKEMCKSEPFYDQKIAAFCSGFLVAPNLIATAGHCIRSASDCADTRFVFNYRYNSAGDNPYVAQKSDVYSCKSIVKQELSYLGADYAVIELDRAVEDRMPLAVRRNGRAKVGDKLFVIGHPTGLPTKFADGAIVRKVAAHHSVASLDTFAGNSGSAVFNQRTHEVEGILVRGDSDFVVKNGCLQSNYCSMTDCTGEDFTHISKVVPYLPE